MTDDATPGWHRPLPVLIVLVGAYLRFVSIFSMPIFNDEAIYALWVRSMLGSGRWLIPLSDGKSPLFYWAAAFMAGLVKDPALGLRAAAALAGTMGIIGTYLVGARLMDRRLGLTAAWLYAILPYMLVNDRLGVPDGMLAALAPFLFLSALRFGEKPGWPRAATLGLMAGAGLLIKTTALLLIPAMFLGVILGAGREGTRLSLAKSVALLPVLMIGALLPGGRSIVAKSSGFLLSVPELLKLPVSQWLINYGRSWSWLLRYLQWPSLLLIITALIMMGYEARKTMLPLLVVGAGPPLLIAALAREWFSRYAVVTMPFIIMAVAIGCVDLSGRIASQGRRSAVFLVIVAFITVPALRADRLLITTPTRFAWAQEDRRQYIEGWPAGYGFKSAVGYIRKRAAAVGLGALTVLVDENMGFPKDGLIAAGLNVRLRQVDGLKELPEIPPDHRIYLYIVDEPRLNDSDFAKRNIRWKEAARFKKPGNRSSWRIYEFMAR